MRKYLFIAILVIGVCALGSWALCVYQNGKTLHTQFKSPKGTYLVKLDAEDSPDPDPAFLFPNDYRNRTVKATIISDDRLYLSDNVIYRGDAFDLSFWIYILIMCGFPNLFFISGMVNDKNSLGKKDKITVSNRSDEAISYLLLTAGTNILIILDLPTGSTIEIPIYLDRLDRFIGCEGKSVAGKSVNFQRVYFSTSEQQESPINYCIKAGNSSLLIQSPELDGKILNNFGDIAVPKGNCGL